MDRIDTKRRSENMSRIRSRDTAPELQIRKIAHAMGLRFRLHRKDLPGSPDIVLPSRNLAIFVHGCFWHRHENCKHSTTPKTNTAFWENKFRDNMARDLKSLAALHAMGWDVLTIWSCECRDPAKIRLKLQRAVKEASSNLARKNRKTN